MNSFEKINSIKNERPEEQQSLKGEIVTDENGKDWEIFDQNGDTLYLRDPVDHRIMQKISSKEIGIEDDKKDNVYDIRPKKEIDINSINEKIVDLEKQKDGILVWGDVDAADRQKIASIDAEIEKLKRDAAIAEINEQRNALRN